MLRGRFEYSMDDKGRISLPPTWRRELKVAKQPLILTSCMDATAVGVYELERWNEVEQHLAGMSRVQPEVQRIRRLLISGAEECRADAQGRIRIPQHLREFADLAGSCLLAGTGHRIEIWEKGRFQQELAAILDRGDEVSRIAADLGL